MTGVKKGLFIAIEGIDGAGSTTQTRQLYHYLQSIGRKAHFTAEPSASAIGVLTREFLRKEHDVLENLPRVLALLFAADRLHHVEAEILPKLNAGIDVVSDRYVLSSLVYQGLDLPTSWVATLNEHAPKPDLTILIDVGANLAEYRRENRGGVREVFDDEKTQMRVRERYLKLLPAEHSIIIDGSADVDTVRQRLFASVDGFLAKSG